MMRFVTRWKLGHFHQRPEDVNHIAVRNVGVPFYVLEIADILERANLAINIQQNYLVPSNDIEVPESGDIPIDVCVSNEFPYSESNSFVKWRMVKPSRRPIRLWSRMGNNTVAIC